MATIEQFLSDKPLLRAGGVLVVTCFLTMITTLFVVKQGVVAYYTPANAFLLAAFLLFPRDRWQVLAGGIGLFLPVYLFKMVPTSSELSRLLLSITTAATFAITPYLIAQLVLKLSRGDELFKSGRQILLLLAVCLAAYPLISLPNHLFLLPKFSDAKFTGVLQFWSVLGVVSSSNAFLTTPLIVFLVTGRYLKLSRMRLLGFGAAVLLTLGVLSLHYLVDDQTSWMYPKTYLFFPLVAWCCFMLTPFWMLLYCLLLFIGISEVAFDGMFFWTGENPWQTVVQLQLFNCMITFVSFVMCLAIYQRNEYAEKFRQMSERLSLMVADKTRELNEKNDWLAKELKKKTQLQMRLSKVAYTDQLTDLPNKNSAFNDFTKHYPNWFVLIGIDNFKQVNDAFGHKSADVILREVGQLIYKSVGKNGMVYRWTGDEFLISIKDADQSFVEAVVRNVQSSFRDSISVGGNTAKISLSFGLAHKETKAAVTDILAHCAAALAQVKSRGRNNLYVYDDAIRANESKFVKIQSELDQGVENHEFCAFFQAIFDTKRRRVVGFEALMRWLDDRNKVRYSPYEFIPVAEQSGQIVTLGNQMIMDAVRQVSDWKRDYDFKAEVSINVSPVQFFSDSLVHVLMECVDAYSVDPSQIKLEITESLFVNDSKNVLEKLNLFKKKGFKLSLDDFGTGYSSLAYIQDYPFDYIKIDKCFIDNVVESSRNQALVMAVLSLAHKLGMEVVAEGVENKEQADYLTGIGVDLLQGYFYSKPLPPAQILGAFIRPQSMAQR